MSPVATRAAAFWGGACPTPKHTVSYTGNYTISADANDGVERIDLVDGKGTVVASIENQPGKQGSLAVYQYLQQSFDILDAKATEHGLVLFAEHTVDACNRPRAQH